jgi:hypothetical protein
MNARTIPLLLLVLLIAPLALAETVELISPAEGTTIEPLQNGFTFTTDTSMTVKECVLFVDDTPMKTIPFNDLIKGRVLHFNVEIPDGQHTWSVSCATIDKGVISRLMSASRTFTAKTVESPVTVKSSGVFRGSMAYELKFKNAPGQQPVTVKKLASGDFIWILLSVPPSTVKKELYVKRFATEKNATYLYLEDLKKGDTYKIAQGENATVKITSSTVTLQFVGIELNRAIAVIYPVLKEGQIPATPVNETTKSESTIDKTTPEETTANETATPPPPANITTPKGTTSTGTESAEKPGFIARFFSWLASLFGA